jgi:predicted nuclease with TOPRIM domain
MADEPENLVLRYLRRIDDKLDRLVDDVRELKIRMTAVEENLASLNRRFDRLEVRVDRIERRLELTETAP